MNYTLVMLTATWITAAPVDAPSDTKAQTPAAAQATAQGESHHRRRDASRKAVFRHAPPQFLFPAARRAPGTAGGSDAGAA